MKSVKLSWSLAVLLVFTAACLYLTFNRHSRTGYFNYHSEIWADKAGYYVYLPALLKYRFDPASFPDSMDRKTGEGFVLDRKQNKILTKYPYGVALLNSPFYLAADLMAPVLGFKADGFSPVYHWSINIAAVFYLVVGMWLVARFLRGTVPLWIILTDLLLIFLATNLFYYSIDETGMPHIYLFFLFSALLLLLKQTDFLQKPLLKECLLIGLTAGLILVTRPTNLLFLSVFFFLNISSSKEIVLRIKHLFRPVVLFPILTGIILVTIPQMIYWKYIYGSWIHFSYQYEGFNWTHPKIIQTWFSPKNGLFAYSPFYLVIIAGMIQMIRHRKSDGFYLLAIFMVLSYVLSSWWAWEFGCSFGARSFVEYSTLWSLPVAHMIGAVSRKGIPERILFGTICAFLILYNLKLTYTYDGCFYGTEWDWKSLFEPFAKILKET